MTQLWVGAPEGDERHVNVLRIPANGDESEIVQLKTVKTDIKMLSEDGYGYWGVGYIPDLRKCWEKVPEFSHDLMTLAVAMPKIYNPSSGIEKWVLLKCTDKNQGLPKNQNKFWKTAPDLCAYGDAFLCPVGKPEFRKDPGPKDRKNLAIVNWTNVPEEGIAPGLLKGILLGTADRETDSCWSGPRPESESATTAT